MSWFGGVHWNTIIQFYPKCGNRWRNTSKFMEGLAELSPIIEIKNKELFIIITFLVNISKYTIGFGTTSVKTGRAW